MRTHLATLAATLTAMGFAATSAAATSGTAASGGSSGGYSAPSGGGFSGGSGGGSSHDGGGGGSNHGGGSGGSPGGGFSGRSGSFSGYGNFGSSGRDLAHGGFQVVGTRPANVITGTAASPTHTARNSLELGPRMGSAAKAVPVMDDKRRGRPRTHPHRPRLNQAALAAVIEFENCQPNNGCRYDLPEELCPKWGVYPSDLFRDCSVPKLQPRPKR